MCSDGASYFFNFVSLLVSGTNAGGAQNILGSFEYLCSDKSSRIKALKAVIRK